MYVLVTPKISLMPWMKIVKEARFLLFLITLFKIFINTCE